MNQHLPTLMDGQNGKRINRPKPREIQIRHLARRYGLSRQQAELLANHCYGEGRA